MHASPAEAPRSASAEPHPCFPLNPPSLTTTHSPGEGTGTGAGAGVGSGMGAGAGAGVEAASGAHMPAMAAALMPPLPGMSTGALMMVVESAGTVVTSPELVVVVAFCVMSAMEALLTVAGEGEGEAGLGLCAGLGLFGLGLGLFGLGEGLGLGVGLAVRSTLNSYSVHQDCVQVRYPVLALRACPLLQLLLPATSAGSPIPPHLGAGVEELSGGSAKGVVGLHAVHKLDVARAADLWGQGRRGWGAPREH